MSSVIFITVIIADESFVRLITRYRRVAEVAIFRLANVTRSLHYYSARQLLYMRLSSNRAYNHPQYKCYIDRQSIAIDINNSLFIRDG